MTAFYYLSLARAAARAVYTKNPELGPGAEEDMKN